MYPYMYIIKYMCTALRVYGLWQRNYLVCLVKGFECRYIYM